MEENEIIEPPVVEPPVEPSVVEQPVVVEPPVVPEGYVPATEVETERTARTAAEERATAAEARIRAAEIREAARELNFNDPSDAERFITADATDFKAALSEVLTTKSYLAKPATHVAEVVTPPVTPTSPTNPARTETITAESVKSMTRDQIAQNWAAVKVALAANK
jgi:hypothetical protein